MCSEEELFQGVGATKQGCRADAKRPGHTGLSQQAPPLADTPFNRADLPPRKLTIRALTSDTASVLCSAIKFRMRERRRETEHKIFPPKLKSSRQASSTKQHAVLCRQAGTPSTPISLRTPVGVCSELGSQQRGVQGYRQECWSTQNTRSVISPPEGECQRTGKLGAGIDTKQRPRRQLEAVQELLCLWSVLVPSCSGIPRSQETDMGQ